MLVTRFLSSLYDLAAQLKGTDLTRGERKAILKVFYSISGPALERALASIADVMHTDTSFIREKAEANEDARQMLENLQKQASLWDAPGSEKVPDREHVESQEP